MVWNLLDILLDILGFAVLIHLLSNQLAATQSETFNIQKRARTVAQNTPSVLLTRL